MPESPYNAHADGAGPPVAADREPSARPRSDSLLTVATVVASGAALARWSGGAPMPPVWATVLLQLPVAALWMARLIRRQAPRGPGARPSAGDLLMTLVVVMGGGWAAVARRSPDPLVTALTAYIAGHHVLHAILAVYRDAAALIREPARLLRRFLRPWLALLFGGTLLLSLPLATRSAVPDYRHRFWQHVLDCGFDAASAACLVGNTVHAFNAEYTPFGQGVLVAITQLVGLGAALLGLAIIQPFLRRPVSPRGMMACLIALQGAGILATVYAWGTDDAPSAAARAWMSLVHVTDALYGTGFVMRPDGLAGYLRYGTVFVTVTGLSVVGALGVPLVVDLLRGGRTATAPDRARADQDPRRSDNRGILPQPASPSVPLSHAIGLPAWEAGAAFWLLIGGAALLWLFETPGFLSAEVVPERPVDFGNNLVSLRDPMDHQVRWSLAMFVSATVRSAGIQSIPLTEGALSTPGAAVMLGWMALGGSIGGAGGGLRTTSLLLLGICLLGRRSRWASIPGGIALRPLLIRRLLVYLVVWGAFGTAALAALDATTDAPANEWLIDGTAAYCGVGLTTGLSTHLTWAGRLTMIAIMIAGRTIPLVLWSRISWALCSPSLHSTARPVST